MKILKLSNSNQVPFDKAFNSFKKFVHSDIEYNPNKQELFTDSFEFDKSNLVTLASFYGSHFFRSTNKLELKQHQFCDIKIIKDYDSPFVKITTEWDEIIEIKPYILFNADFFITRKMYEMLSEESKNLLHEKMPTFNKDNYMNWERFAYVIIKNTMVFIRDEKKQATITNLWRVVWNTNLK